MPVPSYCCSLRAALPALVLGSLLIGCSPSSSGPAVASATSATAPPHTEQVASQQASASSDHEAGALAPIEEPSVDDAATNDAATNDAAANNAASSSGPFVDTAVAGTPAAVAHIILSAWQAKDLDTLAAHSEDPDFVRQLEPGTSRYASIFGGWRWDAVSAWQGKLATVRQPRPGRLLVEFGRSQDDVFVVVLTERDERWVLSDINSPPISDFEQAPVFK